jgi:ABC-type dipeptide/oligopeptide/nickel transport system ATPase component
MVNSGCRFYGRCRFHMDHCLTAAPPLYQIDDQGHEAACYLYDEDKVVVGR